MTKIQELFNDMDAHLLKDADPSRYLGGILRLPLFGEYPFLLLKKLEKTGQSRKYHPEGSVLNHTMLVVDAAAKLKRKSRDQRAFMWAALLHDIGKPQTTRIRGEKITSYDHDKAGAALAVDFLREFTDERDFINKVASLVRWHMQVLFVVNDMPFADISAMKAQTDIGEVALLGLCDRLGRLGADREREEKNMDVFLAKCRQEMKQPQFL